MNLLDDSLSADLARDGALTPRMTERFLALARYAAGTGAAGILFTCSAFGPCIEAVARDLAPMPVLKPNEAMVEEAAAAGGTVGLLVWGEMANAYVFTPEAQRRLTREWLLEPHAAGLAALHSPATAITDFGAVARLAVPLTADQDGEDA